MKNLDEGSISMSLIKKSVIAALFMSLSLSSYAGNGNSGNGNSGNGISACQVIDVKVTTIQLLNGSAVTTLPVPKNSTDCLGAYEGNNSSFEKPTANLGYDNDGWLNKEDYNDWWDGPGAFVDEADLLDLDGDGQTDDPGWVYVSESNNAGKMIGQTSTDGNSSYTFIDDLITFSDCKDKSGNSSQCIGGEAVSGTWEYTPPAQNPDELINLLGGSFFDQVAIVFKAANAFAIYNFSVADLGLDPALAGDYNYAFTGTWDISDVLADKGLSNVTFWARDPINPVAVPEPSSIVLLLLSGVLLFSRNKLKK